MAQESEAKVSWLPSAGRLLDTNTTSVTGMIRCSYTLLRRRPKQAKDVQNPLPIHTSPTCGFRHPHLFPNFPGKFLYLEWPAWEGSLFSTFTTPQDYPACLRLTCESANIWFCLQGALGLMKSGCIARQQSSSAKWAVNKTCTPRSLCHIVHRTPLSPTENPPNKGNMVKRKAMTALSHSSLPLTQHKHQSRPASAGSKRPLGCNLSQTRRRWHAS